MGVIRLGSEGAIVTTRIEHLLNAARSASVRQDQGKRDGGDRALGLDYLASLTAVDLKDNGSGAPQVTHAVVLEPCRAHKRAPRVEDCRFGCYHR